MPDSVQPQPVPTVWGFDITEDGRYVVVIAQTPLGSFIHFLQYDNVPKIIDALNAQQRAADQRRNGGPQSSIVVPGNVVLGPDGNPMQYVPPSSAVQEHLSRINDEQPPIEATAREVEGENGDSDV